MLQNCVSEGLCLKQTIDMLCFFFFFSSIYINIVNINRDDNNDAISATTINYFSFFDHNNGNVHNNTLYIVLVKQAHDQLVLLIA